MPVLLHKWDALITTSLNPSNIRPEPLTDESIQFLVSEVKAESEKIRALLIEGIIDKPKIRDKQQFVQINQAMLVRLLDKLYAYKQTNGLEEKSVTLYDTISRHLEDILNFIEDFFGNYFDGNEKVPVAYLTVSLEDLRRQLELLQESLKLNNCVEPILTNIIVNNFNYFFLRKKSGITYNELVYRKDLMNDLLFDATLASEVSIREILFYFNFNDDDYADYLIAKLTSLTESLYTKKEKITALRFEQKNTNQLKVKLNRYFSANMPSLKEQINQWIEEEIKFLEIEQVPEALPKGENELEDKIHTSLSVSRLALLLKLMVIDKIITNRVIAHVLRITIRTVTTLQKENIAFGSLETKYHNPDRGTISAVKDMLFRWINILNKL